MAEHEQRVFDVERIERNPWLVGLAASPFALLPLLWAAAAALGEPALLFPTFHLVIFGSLASLLVWRRNPWKRRRPVRVEVDDAAITVGGERVERNKLTRGVIVPRDGGIEVHLAKPGADVELRVDHAQTAKRLLSLLGFDADQSVAAFRTMSSTFESIPRTILTVLAVMLPTIALAAAGALIAPALAGLSPLLGMLALFTLMFAPARVEVGADGVLTRWLGTERFISHGEIAHVHHVVAGFGRNRRMVVSVTLTSGRVVTIPVTSARLDDGRSAGLATRILEAREVFKRGGAEDNALLMRGDRPHKAWISALRGREIVGHRTAALPNERLWRVIEDAGAEPVERAAAAVALGKDLGEADRARLARAAKATAAPKLRVVLDQVADADDAQLAEQLASLEGSKAKSKKKR
jgi:hypothetical protein